MEADVVASVCMSAAVWTRCPAVVVSCNMKQSGLHLRSQWHCMMPPDFSVLQQMCVKQLFLRSAIMDSIPDRGIIEQQPCASCSHQCASVHQAV